MQEDLTVMQEDLTVNGVLVRVTGSTNFLVKNDDGKVYIETTAADTFTINGKSFTPRADEAIFSCTRAAKSAR